MVEAFVARQPIFDKNMRVFGYELLFRQGLDNYYSSHDGDRATSGVITDSFLTIGIEEITRGKLAFINFTSKLIKEEIPTLFSPELLAIEILEDVEPDQELIGKCKKLKEMGYYLVLDDFVFRKELKPLIEMADIIKADFLFLSPRERKELPRLAGRNKNTKFLAEKVESQEEFEEAKKAGYSYFQGYFFSKPVIVTGMDIPGYKLTCLQLLREVNREDPDFDRLAEILKKDLSLSYKVLKLINSAAFGFQSRINSLKQALVLLGLNEVRRWLSLLAMRTLNEEKPHELMITSLVRARFSESLASKLGMNEKSQEFFLMGMFSMIDAFLGRPLEELLEELPINSEIKSALVGERNEYYTVLEIARFYEKGKWDELMGCATDLGIEYTVIPPMYLEAIEWANEYYDVLG